ncbi:hypothetical protein QL285_008337 [Trifolium repens]|nr:hypothetical protein QL285_008337 [Trifolium repens]
MSPRRERLLGRPYENNLQHVLKLFSTYFHKLSGIKGGRGTWNKTTSRPQQKQNSDKTMKQKPLLCPDPKNTVAAVPTPQNHRLLRNLNQSEKVQRHGHKTQY